MKNHLWWSAWAGLVFHSGITMFKQDLMGLEKYITYLENMWIDMHWIVGLLIAAMALTIFVVELRQAEKEAREFQRMRDRLIELGHSPEDYGL